ncbi:MAG: VOC family protein [Gemmatimonadales bacterium]|nr:VOC family protein [Gemmatimonadales bacterium]
MDQIDHVEVFVPDRREAADWYHRVLGCEIIPEYAEWSDDPRGPLMISPDGGATKLALFRGEPQGARPTAGFHLVAFRVDGPAFMEFLARASELGLKDVRGEPLTQESGVDHGKAYSVYFTDPYGHRLEVTSYQHEAIRQALK